MDCLLWNQQRPQLLVPTLLLLLLLSAGAATINGQALGSGSRMCKTIRISNREYPQHGNLTHLYTEYATNIGGCQYVNGDVIIKSVGADPVSEAPLGGDIRKLSTDFLDSIVEIAGRLVIHQVNLEKITLKNLRTIRGYNPENVDPFHTIEVIQSKYPTQLVMPKLGAVLRGDVRIIGNLHANLYCHLSRRIDWSSLFQSAQQRFRDDVRAMTYDDKQINVSDYPTVEGICSSLPKCDASCHTEKSGRQLCWTSGREGCQSYHRCSTRVCRNCFSNIYTGEEECCHPSCLGGCTSERVNSCFSCIGVSLEGACDNACPTKSYFNPENGRMETLNSSMLQVGNICVKRCQLPFITDSEGKYCLSECPLKEIPFNGVCTHCATKDQSACVTCTVGTLIMSDSRAEELRGANCTVWRTDSSLDFNVEKLSNSSSLEALAYLRIFYGRLFLKRTDKLATNLYFLRNLKFVSDNFGIMLMHTRYLGLVNLRYAKILALIDVSGLCTAWYPSKRIKELEKSFRVQTQRLTFDNSSEECRNAHCDPLCRDECWGPGPDMCVECRNFQVNGRCYATCLDADSFEKNGSCQACHPQCTGGCSGPAATDCVRCRELSEDGICVSKCSREMRSDSSGICYSVASRRLVGVGVGVGLLVLALLILLPLAVRHYRKRMKKYEMVDLDEYLTDPSNPSDMAKLLIVNDDDVVKQKEIGSGAFGTVYKGILRSSTTKGIRELPVAIKVLRGHSPKLGQELLNEASVLARVSHPYCIRLVALCLTQEPQLITSLMPRGCLLDFVRARRHRIGAERMLRWSLQAAEGMAYLESLGIVHRDLAARNVLLQTPDQIRITDFGLARLLDMSEGEFVQTAGLLPVKWLGVECFESGLFSHKSDVWSYGVLLWEICTFGESPYNPYGIRSVEDITGLLRKGIRLNQPDNCSIDFYNILLSCWLPQPESRPNFHELVASMNECLISPSKYIAAKSSRPDSSFLDTDDAQPGVESGAIKPSQKGLAKQLELNAYICDPTSQAPKLRHPQRLPVASAGTESELCESAILLRTLSNEDADGYLAPMSACRPDKPDQPEDSADGGNTAGGDGLEDYLAPRKA